MSPLTWAGVAAGTALLGGLGALWLLGRRAVARLRRERLKRLSLPDTTGMGPPPRPPSQKNP